MRVARDMYQLSDIVRQVKDTIKGDKLKARAVRGSFWTMLGYGVSQAIRLASNLILTRILFPEAFGLMAIIQVFMQGISMFSDLGIGASIIQNRRGNDPIFLDTAWSVQVIRGILLFLLIAAISNPISLIYDAPILAYLMPVAGTSAIINGLMPMKLQTANRNMILGNLTIIEITSQIISVISLILIALWTHSVWSLVAGGIIASTAKLYCVFRFLDGRRSWFFWDPDSVRDLINFGKWIFLGSIVGFFANQGDKLILASYMTKAELGVYSVAFSIASICWVVNSKLNHHVFFPIYSQLKDLSPSELRPKIYKARVYMCSFLLPPLLLLIIFGSEVINILYDERYSQAGWMIQIICSGYALSVATGIGPFYLAQGNSKLMTILIVVKAVIFMTCMLVGGELFGVLGVIVGAAISHLAFYLVESMVYRYYGLWIWRLDVVFLSVILGVVAYVSVLS